MCTWVYSYQRGRRSVVLICPVCTIRTNTVVAMIVVPGPSFGFFFFEQLEPIS